MYLVDTNIWLERLLGQAKSDEVGQFLDRTPTNQLFITDFAFHSIGVILTRLKRKAALLDFVQDVFVEGSVTIVSLKPEETQVLVDAIDRYDLDFDDAYQYVAAEKNGLVLVSVDVDLRNTATGAKVPVQTDHARIPKSLPKATVRTRVNTVSTKEQESYWRSL